MCDDESVFHCEDFCLCDNKSVFQCQGHCFCDGELNQSFTVKSIVYMIINLSFILKTVVCVIVNRKTSVTFNMGKMKTGATVASCLLFRSISDIHIYIFFGPIVI